MSPSDAAPLRVVEATSGIAGAYCGWLLRSMGARVVRIDLGAPGAPTDPLGLAARALNDGKGAADVADQPFLDADIVITDDVAGFRAASGASLEELHQQFPGVVFGAASVFGLTGPLADVPAVPLDAQAVASVAWAMGEPGRAPLAIPPGVLDCQAGAHLAAACLMGWLAGGTAAGAGIVDVALADVLAAYVAVNCRFYIHHGMTWHRAGRRAAHSGGAYPFVILPCADGDVCLSGRTRAEWERFVVAMGSPAWTQEPRYQRLRAMGQQYPDEVDALVLPWLRQHTKAEIAEIAHRHQLTIAPLRDFAEVLATPQLAVRGFLRPFAAGGRSLLAPGLPFRVTERRAEDAAPQLAPSLLAAAVRPAAGRQWLAGLRVLDLGWVWSAPQVGSILAQFGAEVIKVEHSGRPDNSRLSGTVIRDGMKVEGPTTEMSPMFHQINKGKLGITVNLKEPEGLDLVRRLAAGSDIVLENMSAGTMERTSLGYETLRTLNPRLVMVAMSGAGQFGPLADMRTYAPAMSSFAGLESLVGYPCSSPVGALNFAIGDPNAAAHALVALFGALARREATGTGCYIDLSQTEALVSTLVPYLLQAQWDGAQPRPMGNAHPAMAPHGIYPTDGDDSWISLAVATDWQWSALASLAPDEPWACESSYATTAGRLAARAMLDTSIAAWTRTLAPGALVAKLRAAGIAASPVQDIAALFADAQFTARGAMHEAELPVLGAEALFRAPWAFNGLAAEPGTRGPMLGEHNARVLKGMLGMSDSEFDRLVEAGVIK